MMSKKVRISRLPKAQSGGMYGEQTPPNNNMFDRVKKSNVSGAPEIKIGRYLQPTSLENATLEAEKGETVVTNLQGEGISEFYIIGGKPHARGGTPLNLPPNSFIFSKDRKLQITDETILNMFGKTKPDVPANISKQYDINYYREILANPFSDTLQKETAELMIKNYNNKLGALALVQESKKGFNRGIPEIAIPFLENVGIAPAELMLTEPPTTRQLQKFKKGGQYADLRKIRIVELPKFQSGGLTELSTKSTKRQNIPPDAKKWDASQPDYNEALLKPNDYVLKDGSWYKVTGIGKRKPTTVINDSRLGDFQSDYSLLEEKLKDENVRNALYEQYKKELLNAKPNKRLTQADIDAALALSKDEVIKLFLDKQKINLAVNVKYKDLANVSGITKWDRDDKITPQLTKELGFDVMSPKQIAAFQAAYIAFQNLAESEEYKESLKDFGLFQVGIDDDTGGTTGKKTISKIDGWDGNTTMGQVVLPKATVPEMTEVAYDDVEENVTNTDKKEIPDVKHFTPASKTAIPAKYWTQDLIDLAGTADDYFDLTKYDPWQAQPQFDEATPTFTDFRGTAARLAAQGRGLAGHAATFINPQGFGAMSSHLFNNMVNPILQAQEQEIQANVGIANQFELANTQARNEYNMQKAGLDTALYDKSVIANQEFDNAKRAFKWNTLNAFKNAWTNKGKTQVVNSMYDNYAVDPRTGYLNFIGDNRPLLPENTNQKSFEDEVMAIKKANPGIDWGSAIQIAKGNVGQPVMDYPIGINPNAYMYPGTFDE